MIGQEHPIVERLAALPFTFELVGSRLFQFRRDALRYADWDFMTLRGGFENGQKLEAALKELGFVEQNRRVTSYEDDGGICVWRWEVPQKPGVERVAGVDVLMLYDEKEYHRRLRILRMMRDMGANDLYEALHGKSAGWCDLFGLLSRLEASR